MSLPVGRICGHCVFTGWYWSIAEMGASSRIGDLRGVESRVMRMRRSIGWASMEASGRRRAVGAIGWAGATVVR